MQKVRLFVAVFIVSILQVACGGGGGGGAADKGFTVTVSGF